MTRSPAKQTRTEQREHTRQTLHTALGKLLLLQAGIGKNAEDKPIEVKLDAPVQLVIKSVVKDIRILIDQVKDPKQSQSQAKAEAKPKQTKKPSRSATTRATGVYNKHNQEWSKQ